MAFVVTLVTTKSNSDHPNFATWSRSLDANVVYERFPELTGISVPNIIEQGVNELINPSAGFITEEVSDNEDGSVRTTVTTWESQQDYLDAMEKANASKSYAGNITCNTSSTIVTGNGTTFTVNCSVGSTIQSYNITSDSKEELGVISSIESDTSLTLESNAAFNVSDLRAGLSYDPVKPLAFLQLLYQKTYPVTTEITFANV